MNKLLSDFIKNSLEEDIGQGDITSEACLEDQKYGTSQLITKEPCQIAGLKIAKAIYFKYDPNLNTELHFIDGDTIQKNEVVLTVSGSQKSILATERLVLNCMQRMSGIATKTKNYINKIKDLNTIILDTRKTCPGIRFLDKEAVRLGGGTNHRNGLYDVIMIKENHIDFSGGVTNAIQKCKQYLKKEKIKRDIIIEARNLEELKNILDTGGIDRIMLDNFNISDTKKAVGIVNKLYPLESSGNINLINVREYALCGVDFISIGDLTHSVKNIDLSMVCI